MTEAHKKDPFRSPFKHERKPGLPLTSPPECACGALWPCTHQASPPNTRMEISIAGLGSILFLGWRSTHGAIRIAAISKPVSRALIEARATIDGSLRSAAAILRPGDKFDRETGKRIALARLVEQLVPIPKTMATAEIMKRKQARAEVFREIWKRTHKGALPSPGRTYTSIGFYDALLKNQKNYRKRVWVDPFAKAPSPPVSLDIECSGSGLTSSTTTKS